MARQIRNKEKWHKFTMRQQLTDGGEGELVLVGTGKRCYLWAGRVDGGKCVYFMGAVTLRNLAKAILKEVGK